MPNKKVHFESLDELYQCSEKWKDSAYDVDILLTRVERVEWECSVDSAKKQREEFERLTELKVGTFNDLSAVHCGPTRIYSINLLLRGATEF